MTERPERESDEDPAPTQHSDAERVSEDEAQRVPEREDAPPDEAENDTE